MSVEPSGEARYGLATAFARFWAEHVEVDGHELRTVSGPTDEVIMHSQPDSSSPDDSRAQSVGWGMLLVFLGISFLGALSGVAGAPGEWYDELTKPVWNPPPWIFGPVWTVLYIAIGTSAWWVVRTVGWRRSRAALTAWSVQMVLNIAWTPVFFGLHQMAIALGIIVAMWVAILATIIAFMRLHRPAGLLLIPYLGWVGFATALNATLWWLNAPL